MSLALRGYWVGGVLGSGEFLEIFSRDVELCTYDACV